MKQTQDVLPAVIDACEALAEAGVGGAREISLALFETAAKGTWPLPRAALLHAAALAVMGLRLDWNEEDDPVSEETLVRG